MDVAVALPPILAVILGAGGARLGRALRPSLAVRLLPVAAVLVAAGSGFSLTVVAAFLLARVREIASLGHWSPAALPRPADLPWPAGIPVAVAVALLLVAAIVHVARAGHRLWIADGVCRRLAPTLGDGRTVVVDDDEPDAYAVAGLTGRVVVSTGMLAALDEPQRRVLLAHEAAHLAHRHHLWIQLAEIAAVANPLLRTLPGVVRHAAERWADEDAAAQVGDRRVAARAIARAALARTAARHPDRVHAGAVHPRALASTGGEVTHRVRALLDPPALRWSPLLTAAVAALIAAALTAVIVTEHATEETFEHAQADRAAAATFDRQAVLVRHSTSGTPPLPLLLLYK
ncbi:Zn-dependent protease with chaperone function [Nocardia sp. GAS34]|uniref:M56 family metallopeptidase n=1 Tax=unclassified Nocardia TaxID=2637762 RepID=UPI003D1A99B5